MSKTTITSHPSIPELGLRGRGALVLVLATLSAALGPLGLGPSPAAAGIVAPLPSSDYQTRPACAAPQAGHAACLALELVPETSAARARTHPLGVMRTGPIQANSPRDDTDGLRPADLRDAYFPEQAAEAPASEPQTIALVDAYNDPEAEADLAVYDQEFGLEECSKSNGCFEQVNEHGEHENLPFPTSETEREAELETCENVSAPEAAREKACFQVVEAEGWAVEISTDIEVAHAICQHNCHIVLVEAGTTSYEDLEAAEDTAVRIGTETTGLTDTEVSNSWGGSEPEPAAGHSKATDSAAFRHPGAVITAAAGDDGYLNWTEAAEAASAREAYYVGADYPASSPHVVAVGGTRLALDGGRWESETVWNDDPRDGVENYGAGGSGCSLQFEAQPWQRALPDWSEVGCKEKRAVADVSADGDPYTGVAVYDSIPDLHEENGKTVNTPLYWSPIGGTSVAAPIIDSMFALAGGAHGVEYPAQTLYSHLETMLLHPVTAGGNGECDDLYTTGCSGSMSRLSSRFAFDCGKGVLICNSAPACEGHYYDGPTGIGTPDGIGAFLPEEHAAKDARECERSSQSSGEESKSQGGSGSTSGGAGEEAATGGSGNSPSSPSAPVDPTGATPGTVVSAPDAPATSSPPMVQLSDLTLTANAAAAVRRGRPRVVQVAFAFTLSAPSRVRAVLSMLVTVRGRSRWVVQPDSLATAAAAGRNRLHLRGRHALAPGRYRLTLSAAHGNARALAFVVG
jgi:hypothetical protein